MVFTIVKTMAKTLIFMALVTAALIILMSFLFYKAQISDTGIHIGVICTYLASTFVGGFVYGKIKERRKFLHGIMIGAVYFCILILCSYIVGGNNSVEIFTQQGLIAFVCCVVGGMTGGMVSN
jgi:putative membrane protein (TIGR04086 family)